MVRWVERAVSRWLGDWQASHLSFSLSIVWIVSLIGSGGCTPLRPQAITADRYYLSDELQDGQTQIQRGKKRKVIDAVGWVIGIPSKIVLWNRRIENHNIGEETEDAVTSYLAQNGLTTTRVRLNQYAPRDDWQRLVRNKRVAAPWRYTFGAVATLAETIVPGRVFGGDHYNPYTDTIHLYSDVPAIALHEAGHAKDFARRKWKGTYAAVYIIPGVPLYHESIATRDALAFAETYRSPREQREALNVLYPAYGTYFGSALGSVVPNYASPLYYGSVVTGHIWGRSLSRRIPDSFDAPMIGSYGPPVRADQGFDAVSVDPVGTGYGPTVFERPEQDVRVNDVERLEGVRPTISVTEPIGIGP